MRSSYAVGAPDRDIYGLGADLDDRAQNKARGSRSQSPAFEHPSWGFVSSRAPSRIDDNGFDSEDDGDSDDLGGSRFSLAFGSRVPSRLGNIKKKKKGLRSRKNSFAPGKLEINASSKFREKSDNYKATKITVRHISLTISMHFNSRARTISGGRGKYKEHFCLSSSRMAIRGLATWNSGSCREET
jgi:hypothetical protein